MAPTGSMLDDLMDKSATLYLVDEALAVSREMRAHNRAQKERREILRRIGQGGAIEEILAAEKALLQRDLELYANKSAFKQERDSINVALKQFEDAERCLKTVYDPVRYQAVWDAYAYTKKVAGLPVDCFRGFIRSHRARMSNWLSARGNEADKLLFEQRQENLSVVLRLYADLQRKALS